MMDLASRNKKTISLKSKTVMDIKRRSIENRDPGISLMSMDPLPESSFRPPTIFAPEDRVILFSKLQRKFLICVVDECINKLVILGATKPQYAAMLNFKNTITRNDEESKYFLTYERLTNQLLSETGDEQRMIQFQQERELILKLISLTREELLRNVNLDSIFAYLRVENEVKNQNGYIMKCYKENKNTLNELKWIHKTMKNETTKFIREQQTRLKTKRNELDRLKVVTTVSMIYNYKWHSARYDQNKTAIARLRRHEETFGKEIDEKIRKENIVHEEITKFLKLLIKQLNADVDAWNDLYSRKTEKYEEVIEDIQTKIEQTKNRIEEMDKIMKERAEKIVELEEDKKKRCEFLKKERLREQAAIKIQSWWRGTMVRWEFGKYEEIMKKRFKKPKKSKK